MITFNAHVHEHIMCVHIEQREHNHVHALHLCFIAQTCVYIAALYPALQCCIQSWEGLGTGLHIHVQLPNNVKMVSLHTSQIIHNIKLYTISFTLATSH